MNYLMPPPAGDEMRREDNNVLPLSLLRVRTYNNIYIIIIFASLIRHLFRNGIVFVRGGIISRANNQSNFEDFSIARVFFFFFLTHRHRSIQ